MIDPYCHAKKNWKNKNIGWVEHIGVFNSAFSTSQRKILLLKTTARWTRIAERWSVIGFFFMMLKKKNIQGVSRAVFVLHFCPPSLDLVDSLFPWLPVNWNGSFEDPRSIFITSFKAPITGFKISEKNIQVRTVQTDEFDQ